MNNPQTLPPVATTPVLQARRLSFSYTQKGENLQILQGIDLTLMPGECIAIVGASGSGKSTLLHLLAGLDTPQQGEVTLCGQSLSHASDRQRTVLRNRYMGFVYQFHHLLPEFSAIENIAMPLLIAGLKDKEAKQQAKALLDAVGLAKRGHHRPAELSGGERQRAAIARALVNQPKCLLADEPTGNLDDTNAKQVFQLMRQLVTVQNNAMIIVTHDMSLAQQMDRKFYLVNGQLQDHSPIPNL
ncbi:MAG: lipoprotein-releasing system ATP-binding protein LolD [Cardiobacteriales bacterium]|nr:MAG: lipoprotein-releasing system ATP-binding protein LolD [Cardiobacteriales bacterium]